MQVTGKNYNLSTSKISAALTAYEKLERAWRRLAGDLCKNYPTFGITEDHKRYDKRAESDTDLNPDAQAAHYAAMTHLVRGLAGGNVVSLLEGGYGLQGLGESAVAHFRALQGGDGGAK